MLKLKFVVTVVVILGVSIAASALVLYSDTWPPVYAVQSMSMEHSSLWTAGTINTGDLVFAKSVGDSPDNVITYVQGRQTGYQNYGDYGNVILFEQQKGRILIHRAMFYLSWNGDKPVVADSNNQSWISVVGDSVIIKDVGYNHKNLIVYLSGFVGQSGFITVGDFNLATSQLYNITENAFMAADQNAFGFGPVNTSKVIGKAFGSIPWFGLVKLNIMKLGGDWPEYNQVPGNSYLYLSITIVAILVLVFFPYRYVIGKVRKR